MSEQTNDSRIKEQNDDLVVLFDHRKFIHDLRNGLSPILMQAQLLSQYAETPTADADSIKKSSAAIEQSVKAMVLLLDNK